MLVEIFNSLNHFYSRMDPHHETWELWIRGDKTKLEIFEVAVGTILVQNTNWKNVDKALLNLKKRGVLTFSDLLSLTQENLEEIIKPAGFYKQKASYLRSLARLFKDRSDKPTRKELLSCKGVGRETADSILVYCFKEPIAIVGTYTRRFFARFFGEIDYLHMKYEALQDQIQTNLEQDYQMLGRFHALIVCHCQNYCQKKRPLCINCILIERCLYGRSENTPNLTKIQRKIAKKVRRK